MKIKMEMAEDLKTSHSLSFNVSQFKAMRCNLRTNFRYSDRDMKKISSLRNPIVIRLSLNFFKDNSIIAQHYVTL